jgi:hypothetical protein
MKLIKEIETTLPIPAYPSKGVCEILRKKGIKVNPHTELQITNVVDSGDIGGILCTILEEKGNVFVASLTYLKIKPDHPLSDRILAYQKQRMKWLADENNVAGDSYGNRSQKN